MPDRESRILTLIVEASLRKSSSFLWQKRSHLLPQQHSGLGASTTLHHQIKITQHYGAFQGNIFFNVRKSFQDKDLFLDNREHE